mgnify:CR=1 FL=1
MKRLIKYAMKFFVFIPSTLVFGQGDLGQLVATNGKMYIQPFVTASGMGLNSGLTHTAKAHKLFGFDISIKSMFVTIPDVDKTFIFDASEINLEYTADNGQSIIIPGSIIYPSTTLPTVFGGANEESELEPDWDGMVDYLELSSGSSGLLEDNYENIIETPPGISGIDIPTLPLVRPQISLGLPMNSELLLSYMSIPLGDLGDGSFSTFGLKHGLDQYIPMPTPFLNAAAQIVFQKLDLGVITSSHTNINLQASADFPIVTFYGLLGIDNSKLEASYTQLGETEIKFDLKGENGFRTNLGVRLKLAFFYINADYTIGKHNVFSLGTGITIR